MCVYREANKVTDAIASLGCQMSNSLLVYDSPPDFVRGLLDDDVRGVGELLLLIVLLCSFVLFRGSAPSLFQKNK